jgi:glycosyltransferase involved in cell wall biosynthesis
VYCNQSRHPHTINVGADVVLSALSDHTFQYTSDVVGVKNVGYGFIENNIIAPRMAHYANRLWDHIVCGSTWMSDWLESYLDIPCSVAIQGVNLEQFSYQEAIPEDQKIPLPYGDNTFVVGSFGKFELRKGQDIVIQAMAIFQQRHPDTCLLYNWHNEWPVYMRHFAWNPHSKIKMMYSLDDDWYRRNEIMFFNHTLENNGVSTFINAQLYRIDTAYRHCDVALFPNRCEAGTNLCLMEALACGVPCIATDATGHKDITWDADYPCSDLSYRTYLR